jgi:hypothetical protein
MTSLFNRSLILCCFLVLSWASLFAQDPNYHIYLCFGQSNMEGNGDIEAQDKTGVDARFQVIGAVNCNQNGKSYTLGKWQTATPPIFRCNTGLGPTDYFGRTMVANLPTNIKVGVVPVAIGGCDIALFDKVNYGAYVATAPSWMIGNINAYGGNPYARLVEVAKLAQKDGVIKGILLHQGETNNMQTSWPGKIKAIYDNLIKDLGLDPTKVPLLAGELVTTAQGGSCGGHNAIIATLANVIPNAHVVSASGLPHKGDGLHFTPASYRTFGQRYANMMLSLLPKASLPSVKITAPANNSTLTAPTSIGIAATAIATSGSISNVKFYNGNTLLSTDNSSPYSYDWTNVGAGTYTIKAIATDNQGNSATDTVRVKVNVAQGPYNGTAMAIPGIIQAEFYDVGGNGVAYSDDSPGSAVTPVVNFRTSEDVDIETCTDAGGGYNLGYATAGEWLEYTVNVSASGNYKLDLRVACNGDGRTLTLAMDGTNIATNVAIPNTTGWQTWTTTTVNNVPLTSGQHVLRMTIGATSYININYLTFSSVITGLNSEEASSSQFVFPNPFRDHVNVSTNGSFQYELTNTTGIILEEGTAENKVDFKIQYPKGIYLLKVKQGDNVKLIKLLKE